MLQLRKKQSRKRWECEQFRANVGDKIWEAKAPDDHVFITTRPRIASNSSLMLNSYFQGLRDRDVWDEAALQKRTNSLLPLAIQLWPCPTSNA
jgi:hypothetical protein